jgi:hypothetical protein
MEEEFRAILTGAAAVTALAPASRINFVSHPQGAPLPGVVLTVVTDFENMTMRGPDGLSQGRVQADCYAMTYTQAKQLSRAVRAALSGYSGGGFSLVEHVATRDGREGGSNEAERPFRVSLDFQTHWRAL